MVTIPRLEPSQGLDTAATTMPRIRVSTAVAEAVGDIGGAVQNVTDKILAKQEKLEDFRAQQGWALLGSQLDGDMATHQENSNNDGTDAYPNFVQQSFAPKVQQFIESLPPRKREEFEARVPVLQQGYKNAGDDFARKKTDAHNTDMLADYQLTVNADLAKDPDNFYAALRAGNELIANSGKSQSTRNLLREKMMNEFLSSAVDGYIAQGRFDEARELIQKTNEASADRSDYTPINMRNGTLNPANWPLRFYKPEDLLGRRKDEQFIQARTGYAADELGRRFYLKTGVRVPVNLPHHFDAGPVAGRRRGTSSPQNSPHVSKSQHHRGAAIDFQIQGLTDNQKAEFLREGLRMGFKGVGFYEGGSGHLHLDMGNVRQWGRVPKWAQAVMANRPKPVDFGRSIVSYSRDVAPGTVKGGVVQLAQAGTTASDATSIMPGTKYSRYSKRVDAAEKKFNKLDDESLKERRAAAESALVDKLIDGSITPQDVEEVKDDLTPASRLRFDRAARTASAKETRADTLKQFADEVETVTPETIGQFENDLQDAYINQHMTRSDMQRFTRMARKRVGADPSYDTALVANYRDRVRVALAPDEASDKAALLNRLAALEQFENMVHEHKKAGKPVTAEVLKRFADDVTNQFSTQRQQDGRAKLEMSRFIKGRGRYQVDKDDLVTALTALKAEREKGMPAAEYEKEFNIIKGWAVQLQREETKRTK